MVAKGAVVPFWDFPRVLDALRKRGELCDVERPVAPASRGRRTFLIAPACRRFPGFADKLSDQQAAELVDYLRVVWGGRGRCMNEIAAIPFLEFDERVRETDPIPCYVNEAITAP